MKSENWILFLSIFFLFNCLSKAQIPNYVSTVDLKAWMPFNGNANDESGSGNNGIVFGAIPDNGRFGRDSSAYYYDFDAQIDCGNNASLNIDKCTISAWIFIEKETNLFRQTILSKYVLHDSGSYWMYIQDKHVRIEFSIKPNDFYTLESVSKLDTAKWYNVTVVHSPTIGTGLYINGDLDNSDSTLFSVQQTPDAHFKIGYYTYGTPCSMEKSIIDDIGIWSRPLTQPEIKALFTGWKAGLSEIDLQTPIIVFPNPANNQLNIEVIDKFIDSGYFLTDAFGQVVRKGILKSKNTQIQLEQLCNGIYFLNLMDQMKGVIKIVIQ